MQAACAIDQGPGQARRTWSASVAKRTLRIFNGSFKTDRPRRPPGSSSASELAPPTAEAGRGQARDQGHAAPSAGPPPPPRGLTKQSTEGAHRGALLSVATRSASMVVCTGSIAYDYILNFKGHFKDHILPDKTHILNLSFLVDDLHKRRGGVAGNYAYNLSLLGYPAAVLATAGTDAAEYRDWLVARGVDCHGLRLLDGEITATGFTTTDLDDNQLTGYYGGAMCRAAMLGLDDAPSGVEAVIIGPNDPGRDDAARRASAASAACRSCSTRAPAAATSSGATSTAAATGRLDPDRQRLRARADQGADALRRRPLLDARARSS